MAEKEREEAMQEERKTIDRPKIELDINVNPPKQKPEAKSQPEDEKKTDPTIEQRLNELTKLQQQLLKEKVELKIEKDLSNVLSKVRVKDREVVELILKKFIEPDYTNLTYKIKYNNRELDEFSQPYTFEKLIQQLQKEKPYLFEDDNAIVTEKIKNPKTEKLSPREAYEKIKKQIGG